MRTVSAACAMPGRLSRVDAVTAARRWRRVMLIEVSSVCYLRLRPVLCAPGRAVSLISGAARCVGMAMMPQSCFRDVPGQQLGEFLVPDLGLRDQYAAAEVFDQICSDG